MPHLTEQQQRAVETIDRNVLVSAGAGSGKTMVLIERYIEVLSQHPDATISDIVAVTFTRKAADEMRNRLKARLKQITDAADSQEKKRWAKMLADVDRARIGTIHSLCESVLKSFPAEAEIDPQFELLDDLSRAEMIHESVEQALRDLINEPNEDQIALLDLSIESIRIWVLRQLESIPQYKAARQRFGDHFENLQEWAAAVIQRVQHSGIKSLIAQGELSVCARFLEQNSWPDPKNALALKRLDALRILNGILGSAGTSDGPAATRDMFEELQELADLASVGTSGGPAGKPLRDAISSARKTARDFIDTYPAQLTATDETAFQLLRALLSLIDTAIQYYESGKERSQKVDYNDLIIKTHALICHEHSAARAHYGDRLKAILVDEFQDTNHMQAELLAALCGATSRLFLIGDDKQSIYKFQGADVSTFNEWKSMIADGSHSLSGEGLLLDLSYSFRSHPSIVHFVNEFFRLHFGSASPDEPAHRARHQSLVPSREDPPHGSRVEVVAYDAQGDEEKRQSEKSRASESRAIASWIWEKIANKTTIFDKDKGRERPMSFGDFAVLVPTNKDFGAIEAALADGGIPYVTFAGSGFLNRQEVFDLENMLRWFKCPEDSFSLIAVLRSPFFGINDGIIHRVDDEQGGNFWHAIQKAAKDAEFAILKRPIAILKQLLEDSHRQPLGELVRSIITLTSYDVILLSLPNGKQKSRNAWKMANFVSEYNHLTLSDFLNAIQAMRELGAGKQTDAPLSSVDSVKLMTIHKSKGLEFPAVILPVLGRKIHQMAPKLLVHREFGVALDSSRSKDDPKPSFFKAACVLNSQFEEEEKKRLLYVAMTRARDYLVMFIEQYAKNEQSFRLWLKTALSIDTETNSTAGSLRSGEHYSTRFLDEQSLAQWELASAEAAGAYLAATGMDTVSIETGFQLAAPLVEDSPYTLPAVPEHRTMRVTADGHNRLQAKLLGTFFHLTMQYIAIHSEKPTREMLERMAGSREVNLAQGESRDRLVAEVDRLLLTFYKSRLWELLQTARRVMHEISYTIISKDAAIDKRPDLIFQDSDGHWHIVDFKTDKVTQSQLQNKMNEHSAQVLEYIRDFKQIAGAKPLGWLYFAELGTSEEVTSAGFSVTVTGQLRLPLPG